MLVSFGNMFARIVNKPELRHGILLKARYLKLVVRVFDFVLCYEPDLVSAKFDHEFLTTINVSFL